MILLRELWFIDNIYMYILYMLDVHIVPDMMYMYICILLVLTWIVCLIFLQLRHETGYGCNRKCMCTM